MLICIRRPPSLSSISRWTARIFHDTLRFGHIGQSHVVEDAHQDQQCEQVSKPQRGRLILVPQDAFRDMVERSNHLSFILK